jgi:glutathione synthase
VAAVDFLFVMDPMERVLPDRDTTYALLRAACGRGHRTFVCEGRDVWLSGGVPFAAARQVAVPAAAAPHAFVGPPAEREVADFPVVWIRPDPPFDVAYLELTLMLEAADRTRTLLVNDPAGIRAANEKLYALKVPGVCPRSIVTADPARLVSFVNEVGEAVLKPLSGHGGEGILFAQKGMRGLRALAEAAVHGGRCEAQAYLPDAVHGDKRILLLDGEPLGAVLRVHGAGEERNNLHLGGTAVAAELDDADREIVRQLRPHLLRDGLHFVGLDVIGGRLTEVNVTSPTGIQEIERLSGMDPSARVIEWCEGRAPRGERS